MWGVGGGGERIVEEETRAHWREISGDSKGNRAIRANPWSCGHTVALSLNMKKKYESINNGCCARTSKKTKTKHSVRTIFQDFQMSLRSDRNKKPPTKTSTFANNQLNHALIFNAKEWVTKNNNKNLNV